MDNNKAAVIEKINKILARATHPNTPKAEAESCLEMANKIAAKNGLKIVKNIKETIPTVFHYCFHLNRFKAKFFVLFASLIGIKNFQLGFDGKTVEFELNYKLNEEAFKEIYKEFVSYYKNDLKRIKENSFSWNRNKTNNYDMEAFLKFKCGFKGNESFKTSTYYYLGQELRNKCRKEA